MHKKSLNYYSGNYDQYVQTRAEQEENQMKRYKWEQEQISHMKVRRGERVKRVLVTGLAVLRLAGLYACIRRLARNAFLLLWKLSCRSDAFCAGSA
jgi:hypothetical protein